MRKKFCFAKGVGTGVALGVATVAIVTAVMNNCKPMKKVKKKMGHMLKTVGYICDNISCMMK